MELPVDAALAAVGQKKPTKHSLEPSRKRVVTVEAACSKHRRQDILPLHAEIVQLLGEWLPTLKPTQKLFPGLAKKKTRKMVKRDLAKAGIA